jgi:hypothetical protein
MMNNARRLFIACIAWVFFGTVALSQAPEGEPKPEEILLDAMHSLSSHGLFDYVEELSSEKFGGRLTGTETYNAAADWVARHLKSWDLKPGGDNGTYFQDFPNPYTLVLEGSEVVLHIPHEGDSVIDKPYQYQTDFLPGSTSDSGKVTDDVIYVGYGITAPELGFDEYGGLDVEGKIVLVEPEVPISPQDEPEVFKKWRPYSFHQYKVKNAKEHGAAGMVYDYHIANPNCIFIENFVLTYVAQSIVDDLFTGTGKSHEETKETIQETRTPQSFETGKTMTIKHVTKHHPEGVARTVLGYIEGSDPRLKDEVVIIGAHLDHLGYNHEMMPGANDNASGVAIAMEVARVLSRYEPKPKRSVLFTFFGAEEQGVRGSEYYLEHPFFPKEKTYAYINLDGVGRGGKIRARAGKRYPELWRYFEQANQKYIHRVVEPTDFPNLARPRLDAAHFMWADIPSLSFGTFGAEELPYSTYHKTYDSPEIITPEIMEDLAQLLFLAVSEM